MTIPTPYKLMIKALAKSKARFLKFFPLKPFVEGEEWEFSFRLENIGEEDSPEGKLHIRIRWPTQQSTSLGVPIPRLKRNDSYETPKVVIPAFSDGYAFFSLDGCDVSTRKTEKIEPRSVELYSGKQVEDCINVGSTFFTIKVKTWEEIYEFWALIVASISLAVIALEKIWSLLMIWIG